MISWPVLLLLAHLIGLAWGVGAATVKLSLLLRCKTDYSFVPVYIRVAKIITRQIILGQMVLTLSGICWLLLGYHLTFLLGVKLALVAAIWVLGPFIDNVVEPKFHNLAPATGEPASPDFVRIQKQHFTLESIATLIFYVIIVLWVQR